jgi:glycosyltransferase involved in cell wall biosynthesis
LTKSLEIVIPVLNEEKVLAASVGALHHFLTGHLSEYDWRITIADNGSEDGTRDIAAKLIDFYDGVGITTLQQRGRGRALKKAWLESKADVVAYMDVDLSTHLNDLVPLVNAIGNDGYDVAIGSRLMEGSLVEGRTGSREFTSRTYNLIIRASFFIGFKDAQCGFKALSRRGADLLLPLVKDTGWFFDTELLILAEKNGFGLKEIPVRWHDDPDTRVKVVSTAMHDLIGLARLKFGGLRAASRALAAARENEAPTDLS